jgi:hypothetical protein
MVRRSKMPEHSWDTNEVITWFMNDEYLYNQRKSSVRTLKALWKEGKYNREVKLSQVDWEEIRFFFADDNN